ncbi:hypothetical protein GCM10011512_12920 [Tersicoccus solisilvae]|uniref:DUF2304 domain-containing protein n=1 Tax=Tersicoccus solisilvae TaxID=1882339 RepID=A0ABQ1P5W5_9MICC|nr:DUF2304 domain-containing protein [Tersicoccus solisilvae]GGC87395.1 hypothetical protein GCM10011512_12920 [Tersicoccus solisilvae]
MQFLVQILLVVAVIAFSLVLMRGASNARHMAIRRMLLLAMAFVAVISILFPAILTTVASWFGIGRGTDLVLYGFIVVFLIFMATTYQRFRQVEISLTKLSRRIAIDETPRPWEGPEGSPQTGSNPRIGG